MTTQIWALVGVVVGACLGGLAQIAADTLRSRRDRQHMLADVRRTAYLALFSSVHELVFAAELSSEAPEDVRQIWPYSAEDREYHGSVIRLYRALAEAQLVAPADTYEAASEYMDVVMTLTRVHEGRPLDANFAAQKRSAETDFLRLAQRDLGLPVHS